MSKFIITGGRPLAGEIEVKGAKNSALKILPAALLTEETVSISNLPDIEDVRRSIELLEGLGAEIKKTGHSSCDIETKNIKKFELGEKLTKKLRASIMFVAPLLARFGEVKFPHPGGCVIGAGERPIDLFIDGFAALGAEIKIDGRFYHLKAKRLKGAEYFFTMISVTGTEAMIMAACLAKGRTILKNCAMEPEISALIEYLNGCGAKIKGTGSPTITIEGVDRLSGGKFTIMPDRIETGTFAIMAAATHAPLTITKCRPEHIESLLATLQKMGISYKTGTDWLKIIPAKKFKSHNIKTHEYPGFPTDLQASFTILATQAYGVSMIHETIYDRRLLYADMLTQMGANIIMCDPHRLVVNGPTRLYGKRLTSPDLRAGIAMIIAALVAQGETEIDNIYQIDRGYENICERLKKLGADIKRVD
ncbi:MAG: UDP-N-acetylglucosamine 1-carboxyvinyltransferase [Patescibacteria group bacterium]|nr:UDP-N-acetylglucosamine 1-carboxyvinyltransferase [Patescibacteria group bacterium]